MGDNSSEVRQAIEPLLGTPDFAPTAADKPQPLYTNRFQAIRSSIAYRPLGQDGHGVRLHPKPTVHGTQTAIVVGLEGAPLSTERDQRIKIQFHWQRGARSHHRQTHPSGMDNAPANEASGTWVRVATALAGANWGACSPRASAMVSVMRWLRWPDDPGNILGIYPRPGTSCVQTGCPSIT